MMICHDVVVFRPSVDKWWVRGAPWLVYKSGLGMPTVNSSRLAFFWGKKVAASALCGWDQWGL